MNTLQDQIAALLEEAAPLRLLPDVEAEAKGLPAIVDRINALRAKESLHAHVPPVAVLEGEDAQAVVKVVETVEAVKRGPGRPKKAD